MGLLICNSLVAIQLSISIYNPTEVSCTVRLKPHSDLLVHVHDTSALPKQVYQQIYW